MIREGTLRDQDSVRIYRIISVCRRSGTPRAQTPCMSISTPFSTSAISASKDTKATSNERLKINVQSSQTEVPAGCRAIFILVLSPALLAALTNRSDRCLLKQSISKDSRTHHELRNRARTVALHCRVWCSDFRSAQELVVVVPRSKNAECTETRMIAIPYEVTCGIMWLLISCTYPWAACTCFPQ